MLKLSAKFGSISDMLYVAMFYYKTIRTRKSFKCIRDYKNRVSASIFYDNSQVDRHMYTDAVGGKSWSTKRREAVASDIKLINTVIYIDELLPVQQLARQTGILK